MCSHSRLAFQSFWFRRNCADVLLREPGKACCFSFRQQLKEVPGIPGCSTQGETFEELLENLYEAVEGCLAVDIAKPQSNHSHIMQIAV